MATKNSQQQQRKLACFLPLILLIFGSYPAGVVAQVTELSPNNIANTNINTRLDDLTFPDNGAPTGRRRGGTSRRDGCPDLKTPITALVPGDKNNHKSFTASTVSEYPSFWVYVPNELVTKFNSGEFVLQDENNNDIWRTSITLAGQEGVRSITLPSNPQYALKEGSKYHWYFKVYCGQPEDKPEYFYVDAWVQRVALTPELQQKLNNATSQEYKIYGANELWYDAVTNLADLYRNNSRSRALQEDWTKLLASVGLEEFAGKYVGGKIDTYATKI
jgi:hypothetical protein